MSHRRSIFKARLEQTEAPDRTESSARRFRPHLLPLLALACTLSGVAAPAAAEGAVHLAAATQNVCEREMIRAARTFNVPVNILYAVGLTETGRRGSLQPYAMNIAGKAYFARNKPDAMRRLNEERARGVKLIDLGCMQINHHYHREKFSSLSEMLNPRANVNYAARFLKDLHRREGTWTMAVARYHAGPNNNPAQKRYICRVITNMVATGFGSWTPKAKRFCGQP
ncbi:transglycosylase SLT domain-containing protein [Pseudochelatococcus contaminans]|uniref:Soluble lytic murein transglycosylase-like protein n=1 Tax=Pseudochelatococcus contaminans TaxID=1538103 RepID=A0A7W6EFI9_9HYPH|nr:transglycosylase SLT domain-containing protein [Pseudochelatococcus contaminans]MBB3808357.1 soluble lytic murein transglycosylase-like protein [Pseudochelatococcus contaminans]